MSEGLRAAGVAALETVLAGHVERGELAGLVALVAGGGDVHVTTAGHQAFGDSEPIGRDAIFRIASITKPIAGAAAMLLIEDGAMTLETPSAGGCPSWPSPGSCAPRSRTSAIRSRPSDRSRSRTCSRFTWASA